MEGTVDRTVSISQALISVLVTKDTFLQVMVSAAVVRLYIASDYSVYSVPLFALQILMSVKTTCVNTTVQIHWDHLSALVW